MRKLSTLIIACGALASQSLFGQIVDPWGTYGSNTQSFGDSVTGTREVNGLWDIEAGADVYASEHYERPIDASFKWEGDVGDSRFSASKYYGNIDIVSAKYTYKSNNPVDPGHVDYDPFVYFSIQMFDTHWWQTDGLRFDDPEGLGERYAVRLSTDEDGEYGWLFRATDPVGNVGNGNAWNPKGVEGWYDTNGDVGGPLGLNTPDEGVVDGFDYSYVSDGELQEDFTPHGGSKTGNEGDIMGYARITTDDPFPDDGITVTYNVLELAINYVQAGFTQAEIADLGLLIFEANKGLTDNQNQMWNDKYDFEEAGSPNDYDQGKYAKVVGGELVLYDSNPGGADGPIGPPDGNIYELDTLNAAYMIPEPSTYGLIGVGFLSLLIARRYLKNRKNKKAA